METNCLGRLAVVAFAAGTLTAGCEPTPDEIHAADFGYASIRHVKIDVRHEQPGLAVSLRAELTPSDAETCPPLDPDFAITANDAQPQSMGLDPNRTDAIVFFESCRIHELYASFLLPADTRSIRFDFSQRQAGGFIELPIGEQATMQIGPLSTTTVPVGGTFTADVTLTPTPAGPIGGSRCWYGGHCPRDNPSCMPGEGYSGLLVTDSRPNDATIHLQAQVPHGSFTGARTMFLATSSFFGCLEVPLPVGARTVGFTASAVTDVKDPISFGPFDIEVTDAAAN